jgi:hypothetical protein
VGGVEATVLARLHHVALPLWAAPADSAPAPLLSKLLSSLLSSPLVALLSLWWMQYYGRPSSALRAAVSIAVVCLLRRRRLRCRLLLLSLLLRWRQRLRCLSGYSPQQHPNNHK